LVAVAKLHGTTFAPEEPQVIETFVDVLDQRPAFATIAINAPVGILDVCEPGGRTCDKEARALIGSRRGAAIQSAPIRSQVDEGSNGAADGLSAVTRTLLPRYREVIIEMAPYRQRNVFEVTSELSFYQLNDDQPLRWSKKSIQGQEERRSLLTKKIAGVDRILDTKLPKVPFSHMLDVAAFMWTARRCFARAGIRVPQDPEWDESGLRMEYVR
jgi:predicted RNase H-like nuclease